MATVPKSITADPSQHRQQLTERLNTLRTNESFCDVTVAVKDKEFKAHKVVLAAASQFFLSLVESDMRESNEQLIRIELEEATTSVMEDVLKYIYTGNVLITEESVHNLIETGDYLVLPGLKTLVGDHVASNVAALSQSITADPSQHPRELTERLDTLRRNENFCDVTVAVKGKEFKAHKVVLAAASQFFLSLLESDMRESNEQLIRIELEEATASVVEDVLKYIYTGNVSITEENVHNLIVTADFLVLPGLKTLACDFLGETVATENCVFNYCFADKYHCIELKAKSCEVIKLNFTTVMKTDDFLNLDAKQVMEWVSSDDITVSAEEEVFNGIVKWVSHNKSEREKNFPDLLRQVRLLSLSHKFLLDELVKGEIITTNNDCLNFLLAAMKGIFIPSEIECVSKPPRKCLETHIDVIFVSGGIMSFCYLPQHSEWYQLDDMILEHQDHDVIQCRDKVFVFSAQKSKYSKRYLAEYYMSSNDSWRTIQPCFDNGPSERRICSVSLLNDAIYALVVDESTCRHTSEILEYYPDINWLESLDLGLFENPHLNRWGACGVSDGQHLFIMGGTYCGDREIKGTSTVVKFARGFRLEKVTAMNEARHDAFGAFMNGKIYVAGGMQRNEQICSVLNTCEVYDPSTNEWQLIPSLHAPRHSASMVCFQGVLYVVGGLKDKRQRRELSVEIFDSETNEWKEKSTVPVICEHVGETGKKPKYKACFARVHRNVLSEIKTIQWKHEMDLYQQEITRLLGV